MKKVAISFQVCWSGRYVDGAGAGSGEDMEQFFSHLSRTSNTTKYMSAAGLFASSINISYCSCLVVLFSYLFFFSFYIL